MKKIFFSLLAVAAIAACTKSEVAYEAPAEIGFAPVKDYVTKATGIDGALPTDQELGIWAYWDNDGAVGTVSDFTAYNDNYLVNALFARKTVGDYTAWGGANEAYPWPVNGALVFAGYTTPGNVVLATGTAVSYDLASDTMTFTDYANTDEFDLCWFGRTPASYNYRESGEPVDVELAHALTWITVQVYAEGTPVGNWTIESMSLANVVTAGTATCVGTVADWEATTTATSKDIYTAGTHVLSATKTALTDNLIIPSLPLNLTVNYSFLVNGVEKTDSKTVSLKLNDANTEKWQNGVHYTYTLFFKGTEILVAPSYKDWTESPRDDITVE